MVAAIVQDLWPDIRDVSAPTHVTRYLPGAYSPSTGHWGPGSTSVITVDAFIHPATPDETDQLPEGERRNEMIGIYTEEPLRAGDVATGQQADIVEWADRLWKVVLVEPWQTLGGFVRHIAVRLGS